MSKNPATAMDVDTPVGTLKRCSSAPMINENSGAVGALPAANSTAREQHGFNVFGASNSQMRTRRFSASFSPISGSSNMSGLRLTPRISQLRQEEHADISNSRELAHEREIHNTMQISQSWEDLSLMPDSEKPPQPPQNNTTNNNKMGLLHVSLPASYSFNSCSSPSPTRGFQSPTRSRTIIRRSASPVLKPSPLGVKRKLEDLNSEGQPRAKRLHSYGGGGGGGLLVAAPGSLSSVGTPESLSSADSPGFAFRMIDSPSPNEAMIVVSKSDHDMAESPS